MIHRMTSSNHLCRYDRSNLEIKVQVKKGGRDEEVTKMGKEIQTQPLDSSTIVYCATTREVADTTSPLATTMNVLEHSDGMPPSVSSVSSCDGNNALVRQQCSHVDLKIFSFCGRRHFTGGCNLRAVERLAQSTRLVETHTGPTI